jgi:site-specific DNA-methyltransferase (adenine-specific)
MCNPVEIINRTYEEIFGKQEKIKQEVVLSDTCKLYLADCIDLMDKMHEDNIKVDLTVTSPPYDCLRTYLDASTWNFEVFKKIAQRLYDVTSDGGVVVWVVGDATVKGSETGTSFRQALYFMELGFKLHDTMIYEKNSSSFPARRDGNRYTQIFEYMFVFSKGKMRKDITLIADKQNKWAGHTSWGDQIIYDKDGNKVNKGKVRPVPEFSLRNNIWKFTNGFNMNKGKHPAVFPYQLAKDHILSWSKEGDTILDPFIGSGTTAAAAIETWRKFIGIELNEKYYKSACEYISELYCFN